MIVVDLRTNHKPVPVSVHVPENWECRPDSRPFQGVVIGVMLAIPLWFLIIGIIRALT